MRRLNLLAVSPLLRAPSSPVAKHATHPARKPTVALEDEQADGIGRVEKEREFYVKISDFDQLQKAAKIEHQEQWSVKVKKSAKNAADGQFRVRKVHQIPKDKSIGTTNYYFTTKVVKGPGERDECTIEVSEHMFNMFKMLAEGGMIKDRYSFPVEGTDLVYEVDMFLKEGGTHHEWAKIDLENAPQQPPPLPIVVDEFIDGKTTIDEERRQISDLYENYFLTPNVFLNGGAGGVIVAKPEGQVITPEPDHEAA